MKLDIRSGGFELTPSLRSHAERRLAFALSRFSQQVAMVVLRMEDTNGPKGGVDKRCRIETRLDGQVALVVEAVEADLYSAIDTATERMARSVARQVERAHDYTLGRASDWALDSTQT